MDGTLQLVALSCDVVTMNLMINDTLEHLAILRTLELLMSTQNSTMC